MIISVSTATHCLSSRHLPRTSMSGLTTKRTELVFSWMALWCTWTHHTAQPPARLGDLFECIFKKGRLRALSTENVLHILVENKNINMDLRIAFCLDPRTKMVFSMPGRFPFFSQSKQKQYLIPCLYRCGTGSCPHKCYKLLDRSVLEFPLFKRANYGNLLHSGVSLTSCNWKLKIQFNIYSFLFASKDHTVCFGIDVIQGCPTYCT